MMNSMIRLAIALCSLSVIRSVAEESSTNLYFDGALHDIRIWNVSRSPTEIQADMINRLTGKEPGFVISIRRWLSRKDLADAHF